MRTVATSLLVLVAGVGLTLFIRLDARAPTPLLDPSLWRQDGLRGGLAMNTLVSMVMMATLVVGPFYLARALGLVIVAIYAGFIAWLYAALTSLRSWCAS